MAQDSLTRAVSFAVVASFGVGAELASGQSFWWAALDLSVGLAAAAAAIALRGLPEWTRALAFAFAVLWFLGTLDSAGSAFLAGVGGVCVLAYRGPLLQLLLRVGPSRPGRWTTAVMLAGWVVSFLPFGAASPLSAALAATVFAILVRDVPRAAAGTRQALLAAGSATGGLVVVWSLAAAGLAGGKPLLAFGDLAVLAAIGAALSAASGAWAREAGRALVIELGPARRPGLPLTSRLARALADPDLEVRYRVPDVGWLNEQGREAPPPHDARRTTRAAAPDGGEIVLIHGRDAPGGAALARAAASAAAISLEAARLDAEVRLRAEEVAESRRRLLDAVDAERRTLEQRLTERVLARLRTVDRLLTRREYESRRRELWAARSELVSLARGLYPPAVVRSDLGGGLRELAARFELPTRVEITGDPDTLSEHHRAAVWFVCSESLTNIARHARASSVDIRVRVDTDRLELEIGDDGGGGATVQRGLRGLADRIEALGGSFALSSPPGGPTVVRAVLRSSS